MEYKKVSTARLKWQPSALVVFMLCFCLSPAIRKNTQKKTTYIFVWFSVQSSFRLCVQLWKEHYFNIHVGSFLIASFSGPRMATPHVLWPTLRYLQGNNQLISASCARVSQRQTQISTVTTWNNHSSWTVLPLCHFHQAFMIHSKELFSVTLLHLICDSTEEATRSCSTKRRDQLPT